LSEWSLVPDKSPQEIFLNWYGSRSVLALILNTKVDYNKHCSLDLSDKLKIPSTSTDHLDEKQSIDHLPLREKNMDSSE
jgi:hypothetical protein